MKIAHTSGNNSVQDKENTIVRLLQDGDNEEESEDNGEVFEFVELDVGEAAMPTAEFTAELIDSSDDDSEDSDDDDDSSDDYEVVEIVPPLENERDEL